MRHRLTIVLAILAAATAALAADINGTNWGTVVAPVYGTSQTGTYAGAELFAGPNQFNNNYYAGVLPNGRVVKPAGTSVQVGANPLGVRLTPDGKYLVTSNDDEREGNLISIRNSKNLGGYSLSVIDTATMSIVSQINAAGKFFVGLQITGNGPYTVWASGGPDNDVKLFTISTAGAISVGNPAHIVIAPTLPSNAGYVSNYNPAATFNTADSGGIKPAVPSGFDRTKGAKITFPAGSALSRDGKFLYVACNGDNSLAVIDTGSLSVVKQVPVGYFPYDVTVRDDNAQVFVTNWGVAAYKFAKPTYDTGGNLTAIDVVAPNDAGYFVPQTDTAGSTPKTSSVSIIDTPSGNGASASLLKSLYEGKPLDMLNQVGDTHPSATALVTNGFQRVLYVVRANSDALSLIDLTVTPWRRPAGAPIPETTFDLSPVTVSGVQPAIHGAYPNALVASADGTRLYVAEAGFDTVAVLDTTKPVAPKLIGRIPTGWYPSALTLSSDGRTLYIVNAKGVGEDSAGSAAVPSTSAAPGLSNIDSNFIFGTVQKVDVSSGTFDLGAAAATNYAIASNLDTSVVPAGGAPSDRIKHVFFILHENKTFDSMLGDDAQFGPYASSTFTRADGTTFTDHQFNPVALNTDLLARTFGAGVNYYSDSEESDAGHQFAASGTATDYTEKTLLVKSGRGLLVNKNFEPEDYPEAGYIFNNAARHGVSFKDYGALVRIQGTDTGSSTPTLLNDPPSGNAGYPTSPKPLASTGDVNSKVQGLGQSYFMNLPILAILGTNNTNGEGRLDHSYPGYNFNISDQRRAQEFIADFDRMVAAGTLPAFLYIYQPNDHTGGQQAQNVAAATASQQVDDGDVAFGMVVSHIMSSPVYYDAARNQGSAIFMTYDDAQSSLDHIHPHRTPLIVVSPFAKPSYMSRKHYDTASIVKTEELLLGLPPSNLGDLLATDLRDFFQPAYNGITANSIPFSRAMTYKPSPEGRKVWALVKQLDTSAPDRDSQRLGALGRLSIAADQLHAKAAVAHQLRSRHYREQQKAIYLAALQIVNAPAPRDLDD